MSSTPLAAQLLRCADWFNDALLRALEAQGWPSLSRNQAQVFPLLTAHGISQSTLARGLGVTRQSAHKLIRDLTELGIVDLRSDPQDARTRLVVLTDKGERLADEAGKILATLEAELERRIGHEVVEGLKTACEADWGIIDAVTPESGRG